MLATASCLPVPLPVPTPRHTPSDAGTRSAVDRSHYVVTVGTTSREELLWQLGEPDMVSADERFLVYRWLSISGHWLIGSGGVEMGDRRQDLLFEFDESGRLVRHGEVESLVTRPIPDETPIDATIPLELPILQRKSAWHPWTTATLRLEQNRVALFGVREPIEISPAHVTHLEHVSDVPDTWLRGWLSYRMHYVDDEGLRRETRFQIGVFDVLRLAKYLQARQSGALITNNEATRRQGS
ncbi:MAG: hypothetical protein JSV80_06240 [Acidobacteriota bacterium]|nr:MAG: hypothetical protein JSV80_06240 [Acidobacteriota bacterium]